MDNKLSGGNTIVRNNDNQSVVTNNYGFSIGDVIDSHNLMTLHEV